MTNPIHLHPIDSGPDDPVRLNAFPGRSLGEREFDLLQVYAETRLDPLLTQVPPGIVSGLEVASDGSGVKTRLRLRPGAAVGGDGRPIRLFYPLDLTWGQLLELHRRQAGLAAGGLPRDGLWLITLRRGIEPADAESDAEPCTRNEPDPLRDRRLETVALAGLQLVTANPRWLAMTQARAANRVCVRHLTKPPFDPQTGAVPLALVRIKAGAPVWIEPAAGRIEARPDGAHRAFLAHTLNVLEARARGPSQKFKPKLPPAGGAVIAAAAAAAAPGGRLGAGGGLSGPLDEGVFHLPTGGLGDKAKIGLDARLGLDYLPAAGPFPADLIRNLGTSPELAFAPDDLQVELAPIPARVVPATLARELPRGALDLIHGHQERIRILMAIDDPDYRPDLLNLPETDLDLAAELDRRGQAAAQAHLNWRAQWQTLYEGLDADGLIQAQAPALPDPEPEFLANLVASHNLAALVAGRAATLPKGSPLPEPYATWKGWLTPCDNPVPEVPAAEGDGLHARRAQLKQEIAALEDELELNFDLLNALGDYQTLQRQQLDAITVSFSTLAGGVPGDGSGSTLSRWSNYAVFRPTTKTP